LGQLKLADFGLARALSGKLCYNKRMDDYTNRVITLWYRSPELLLGSSHYGPEVDIWSAGCILLEMYKKEAVFRAENEIDQLKAIYEICGTLTPEVWEDACELPWFFLIQFQEVLPRRLRERFDNFLSPKGLDLIDQLLCMNPTQRPSAATALSHPWFTSESPAMCKPEEYVYILFKNGQI
jgi:CTD kinase subunit alpha